MNLTHCLMSMLDVFANSNVYLINLICHVWTESLEELEVGRGSEICLVPLTQKGIISDGGATFFFFFGLATHAILGRLDALSFANTMRSGLREAMRAEARSAGIGKLKQITQVSR